MIDRSRFVYVNLNYAVELEEIVREALVENGFEEKRIIFFSPAKFAHEGDYFADLWLEDKMLYVDRVGKAKTENYGRGEVNSVQSDEHVFSIDLSDKIKV